VPKEKDVEKESEDAWGDAYSEFYDKYINESHFESLDDYKEYMNLYIKLQYEPLV